MTYEEFRNRIEKDCLYETIYTDNVGRDILVIRLLDAFEAFKPKDEWVGLEDMEVVRCACDYVNDAALNMDYAREFAKAIEAKLKEKNT